MLNFDMNNLSIREEVPAALALSQESNQDIDDSNVQAEKLLNIDPPVEPKMPNQEPKACENTVNKQLRGKKILKKVKAFSMDVIVEKHKF